MSDNRKRDPHAGDGQDKSRSRRAKGSGGAPRGKAGDLGAALRTVYDSTLREDVPDDFLDLLGKLR